ncbi:Protein of uncharacterised function (DUF1284) [Pannonibacter phragmitetus]|uniref:Protein of uncharacterized function (DUF1284) n=1 Tax=Pannonibacter phragmitetus TaxID=121719 RepID=A0A378ZSP0_9HYPH|nr:DUF1284 domain-containing protein [Pannonibacter phragmitetus]SUB00262.1 Protein of uncharacterised function (DUF1284) [Pannonibacter phragmitetus]
MTIRLRGHHLLCMLTFVGEGYSPRFVANYAKVIRRMRAGEPVLIVQGPDDICAPLLDTDAPHCHRDSVLERDRLALESAGSLLGRLLEAGSELIVDEAMLNRMQDGFASGELRPACNGCEWSGLCDKVAEAGFEGTRFMEGTGN